MIAPCIKICILTVFIGVFLATFTNSTVAQIRKGEVKSHSNRSKNKKKLHKCNDPAKRPNSESFMKKPLVNNKSEASPKHPKQEDCQQQASQSNTSNEGNQVINKPVEDKKPCVTAANRAGTFTGDLRDLPKTRPTKQKQPKPGEPKTKPKVYKNPTIKPDQE
jgi:hypothetical protein